MEIILTASLDIQKLPDGGYIVGNGFKTGDYCRQMCFASTSIDEALKYIKATLEPKLVK